MNLSASILSSNELSFSLSKDLLNTALFKSLISSVIRSSCCLIVRASSANDLLKFNVRINNNKNNEMYFILIRIVFFKTKIRRYVIIAPKNNIY